MRLTSDDRLIQANPRHELLELGTHPKSACGCRSGQIYVGDLMLHVRGISFWSKNLDMNRNSNRTPLSPRQFFFGGLVTPMTNLVGEITCKRQPKKYMVQIICALTTTSIPRALGEGGKLGKLKALFFFFPFAR